MIYPIPTLSPSPNADMPEDVMADYEEARSVQPFSPKASAALLRLAIQRLCRHLGYPGKDLNADIGAMVSEKKLPQRIQRALDGVRVIGNESVHPGTIDLNDSPQTAAALFKLVNLIVDATITQEREVAEVYDILPDNKKKGIEDRDAKTKGCQ